MGRGGARLCRAPSRQTATEADIIQFARERLAHFKAPSWVLFVNDLPKTATGKIQKYVLRGGGTGILETVAVAITILAIPAPSHSVLE